jgi:phosphoenolpyruvate-protein kinase (PTS system EI component)
MQVDQLSMNPASIPLIKDLIRSVSFREAEAVLQQVRVMEDTDEISAFLDRLGIFEKYRYY